MDGAAIERVRVLAAACGGVLAIDGRSGAGKSTLAATLGAPVVSLEDLYGGWDGLRPGIDRLVREVLEPLRAGRTALVPRYDWHAQRWAPPWPLERPPLLVVEGVGAGALAAAPYVSALVWVEASDSERRRRTIERDGAIFDDARWVQWTVQEDEYVAGERPQERADLRLR
jgi:uridine kinase